MLFPSHQCPGFRSPKVHAYSTCTSTVAVALTSLTMEFTRQAHTQHTWKQEYQEALDYDVWGQVEEAVGCYHRLQVATSLEGGENKLGLPGPRRAAIAQLGSALKLRMQELNSSAPARAAGSIGLAGMQALKPFVAGLIMSDVQLPPSVAIALKAAASDEDPSSSSTISSGLQQLRLRPQQQDSEDLITTTIEQQESTDLSTAQRRQASTLQTSATGTLRTAPKEVQPGDITLSISFGSWSAKGAEQMTQPHVLLTVRDKRGKLLEAVQESPQVCGARSGAVDKLDLDFVYHLQAPLNCLPEAAAVFMELRHWKADKKKMSVKCYALLPYEELLRPGAAMLQLYKKPTDYKARVQRASYTSKPMYVHVIRTLNKH